MPHGEQSESASEHKYGICWLDGRRKSELHEQIYFVLLNKFRLHNIRTVFYEVLPQNVFGHGLQTARKF